MKTDSQSRNEVLAQPNPQPQANAAPQVNAAPSGGAARHDVVTPCGQMAHFGKKAAAEDAAKGVLGVQAVANEIEVELPASSDIGDVAVSALKRDFEVPPNCVKVVLQHGWVTLEGTVDSKYERDAIQRCVQVLMGVPAVTNSISVKAAVKPLEVQTDSEDALQRAAQFDAPRIGASIFASIVSQGMSQIWNKFGKPSPDVKFGLTWPMARSDGRKIRHEPDT